MTGERCDHCGKGRYIWDGFSWYCDWCGDVHPNGGEQWCQDLGPAQRRETPLGP